MIALYPIYPIYYTLHWLYELRVLSYKLCLLKSILLFRSLVWLRLVHGFVGRKSSPTGIPGPCSIAAAPYDVLLPPPPAEAQIGSPRGQLKLECLTNLGRVLHQSIAKGGLSHLHLIISKTVKYYGFLGRVQGKAHLLIWQVLSEESWVPILPSFLYG